MKKLFILLSGIGLLCTGCNRYYYKPNAVNAPLFTGANQLHIAGDGMISNSENNTDGGNSYFFDVQAAYSPINHLGIIANYSTWAFRPTNLDFSTGNVDANAHLAEIGIGGYVTSGQGKAKFVADLYAGGGAGLLKSDVDMKARRFFIQPGIGMRHPAVDLAFNMRISSIKYYDFDDNGRGMNYLLDHNLYDPNRKERMDENNYLFWEPSFTVRSGYKFIKAQFQWALAADISNVRWNYNGSRFTFGLYFSLEDALDLAKKSK